MFAVEAPSTEGGDSQRSACFVEIFQGRTAKNLSPALISRGRERDGKGKRRRGGKGGGKGGKGGGKGGYGGDPGRVN